MFDSMFARATDAEVVAAIEHWTTAEAAAAAHRLAAIAELGERRTRDDEQSRWACDELDAAAAEVSAAMGIGHGRALNELDTARLLRGRLPAISALFLAGRIHSRVARTTGIGPTRRHRPRPDDAHPATHPHRRT